MKIFKRLRSFNSSRERLNLESIKFASAIPEDAYVLDAGSGESPYRKYFTHTQYETADFLRVDKQYAKQTYVCDLSCIPVENERFNFILFSQVMEHLPDPQKVICELYRILAPGGQLICTAPLFYAEHEQPYDFYRFTQFGIRHLFSNAGFTVERLDWLEGYYGTLGYQLSIASRALSFRPADYGNGVTGALLAIICVPLRGLFATLSIMFHYLEMRHKFTEAGLPKNYVAILSKPILRQPL